MMRQFVKYKINLIILLAAWACYDDININIFDNNKQEIIIEAVVTDTDSLQQITIFRTVEYREPVNKYPVESAEVFVRENDSEIYYFIEKSPGIYENRDIAPKTGNTYQLNVITDSQQYQATEVMVSNAQLDSTEIIYFENNELYDDGYYILIYGHSLNNNIHYYKAEITVNDSLYNNYDDLLIFEDSYTNENQELLIPYAFQKRDNVIVELHSISENIYEYFYKLYEITNLVNPINSETLNPPSNISNGSLGYFQVSTVIRLKITI